MRDPDRILYVRDFGDKSRVVSRRAQYREPLWLIAFAALEVIAVLLLLILYVGPVPLWR